MSGRWIVAGLVVAMFVSVAADAQHPRPLSPLPEKGTGSRPSSMAGTRIRTARSAFVRLLQSEQGRRSRSRSGRTTSSRRRSMTGGSRHPSRSSCRTAAARGRGANWRMQLAATRSRRAAAGAAGGGAAPAAVEAAVNYAERTRRLHGDGPGRLQGRCRLDAALPGPDMGGSGAGEVHGLSAQLADGDGVGSAAPPLPAERPGRPRSRGNPGTSLASQGWSAARIDGLAHRRRRARKGADPGQA